MKPRLANMTVRDEGSQQTVQQRRREFEEELSLMGPHETSVKQWLLLRANRVTVSAAILVGVFCVLLGTSLIWPFEMQNLLTETTAVQTLFNTLLGGIVLLVTIVVSINSIVLSQDLTSLDTQTERVESTMEFQKTIESVADVDTCPTQPAAFLHLMLDTVLHRVQKLHEAIEDQPDDTFHQELAEYLHLLEGYTNLADQRLAAADPDSITVLIAGLQYDYAGAIHSTRDLRARYEENLNETQREALDDLVEVLKLFAIGHEYFKSLFYMREFGKLSKALLYVSLPVIVIISYVVLAISAGEYPVDSPFQYVPATTVFTMAAYTIALAPYIVLTAFILRSATVASRSLAAGPFVLTHQT